MRERIITTHRHGRVVSTLEPTIGQVVLINDLNAKRSEWLYGRITQIHTTSARVADGADVKTASGNILRRSNGNLYPLEIPA